jgi:GTP cyclohydrolase I
VLCNLQAGLIMKTTLTNAEVLSLAFATSVQIRQSTKMTMRRAYAIPRGGIPAAYAVSKFLNDIVFVRDPKDADFFIDDIIDTGTTMERYCDEYPGKPFYALVDKLDPTCPLKDSWVVFPWEESAEGSIENNIQHIIKYIGDDPQRGGLLETPKRVAKALGHWFSGYNMNPADVLKTFEDGGESYDQMVTVKDIPIYSHCEHHMAPIFGTVTISYIPNGKIVGLSKLQRLSDIFAKRLQVQERLTNQIADALQTHLEPQGVGVMIKARHMCMESRGVRSQGHHTITTALRGAILNEPATRSEFMSLAK